MYSTSEVVGRIDILLQPNGFKVCLRHGYCWMEFPDGCATHIVPLENLPALDQVDRFVADVCAMADLRKQALNMVRSESSRCGWDLEECDDGLWVLVNSGASLVIAVDWTLTDDLRAGGLALVSLQLSRRIPELKGRGGRVTFVRELAGESSTSRTQLIGEASRQNVMGPVVEVASPQQASRAARDRARTLRSDGPLSDDELDGWSFAQLIRWRRCFEGHAAPLQRLLEPCWLVGADDWISREALLAGLDIYCQTIKWPGFGQLVRLRIGETRYRSVALSEWDEWERVCGCDADALGFYETAAYFYAERELARTIVREMDGWRAVERALIAGQPSALHCARALLSNSLRAVSQSVGEQRENDVYGLFEVLARVGECVARLVVDEDEATQLRAICMEIASGRSDNGWAVVINMLHVACYFAWSDVAKHLLDSEEGIQLVLSGSPEFGDSDYNLIHGALALSVLAPAKAMNLVIRPACERLRVTSTPRRGDDEEMLALAISWWRCRRAHGAPLNGAHLTV